jgi:hypothetical protein
MAAMSGCRRHLVRQPDLRLALPGSLEKFETKGFVLTQRPQGRSKEMTGREAI